MGMDVYGRNPMNEDGEYFRASIWTRSTPSHRRHWRTAGRDGD
jgi:hypothetical protein